ncbi:hypothetical protein D3C81_1485140 [compost metagenome]
MRSLIKRPVVTCKLPSSPESILAATAENGTPSTLGKCCTSLSVIGWSLGTGGNVGVLRLPGLTTSSGGCPGEPMVSNASRLPSMFWNNAGLFLINSRVLLSLRKVRN